MKALLLWPFLRLRRNDDGTWRLEVWPLVWVAAAIALVLLLSACQHTPPPLGSAEAKAIADMLRASEQQQHPDCALFRKRLPTFPVTCKPRPKISLDF